MTLPSARVRTESPCASPRPFPPRSGQVVDGEHVRRAFGKRLFHLRQLVGEREELGGRGLGARVFSDVRALVIIQMQRSVVGKVRHNCDCERKVSVLCGKTVCLDLGKAQYVPAFASCARRTRSRNIRATPASTDAAPARVPIPCDR